MTGVRSKKRTVICAACLFFIFMCACGNAEYSGTTVVFEKDGSILLHIQEEFDESLYDYDELCRMNEQEVASYNNSGDSKEVEIKDSSISDNVVSIDIAYAHDGAYYDMNGSVIFWGDCKTARSAGYNLVGKVKSTSDGKTLDQKTWKDMSGEKVAVVSEPVDVRLPGDILYIGEGLTLTGKNSAKAEEGGLRYIICK